VILTNFNSVVIFICYTLNNMKKVLILTASYGAGHVKASEALIEQFSKKHIQPHVIDLVLQGGVSERMVASFYALLMRKGHFVWKSYHDKIMPIKKGEVIRSIYEMLHRNKFIKEIEKVSPDIIVSTMDTASLISHLYKKKHPDVKTYTVLTDYVAHPLWVWKSTDHYFVGSNEAQNFLIEQGVDVKNISISGIPLRASFEKKIEKHKARKALGIPEDMQVVLISTGTYKSVPVEPIIQALSAQLLSFAVILAGNSSENVVECAGILKEYGVQGRAVSYAENMEEFMAASDVYISKAGGLTVAECLASGLPALYMNNFPGHEEGNAGYAFSHGAAITVSDKNLLKETLENLLKSPEKIQEMSKNALKIAKPHAAGEIVDKILL